jgi:hypothetical protein
MDNIDLPNKILILKLLDKVQELQKDFKEMKEEIEKHKSNNDFINIQKTHEIVEKKQGWFF